MRNVYWARTCFFPHDLCCHDLFSKDIINVINVLTPDHQSKRYQHLLADQGISNLLCFRFLKIIIIIIIIISIPNAKQLFSTNPLLEVVAQHFCIHLPGPEFPSFFLCNTISPFNPLTPIIFDFSSSLILNKSAQSSPRLWLPANRPP